MTSAAGQRFTMRSAVRALAPFIRPHWKALIPALGSVVLTSLVGLAKPWPLKFLLDEVLDPTKPPGDRAFTLIILIATAIVAIALLQGFLGFVKEYFLSAMSQRVAFGLRRKLFGHLQDVSLAFHDSQRTGDLIMRLTNDVTRVQEVATDQVLIGGVTSVLQFVGMLVIMLALDWKLGLLAAVSAPLIWATSMHYRARIRGLERDVREKEGDIASLAQETISSIRVVKTFGGKAETRRFEHESGEMLEAGLRVARLEARFSWTLSVITALALALLVIVGANQVLAGAITAGTLVVFIQYLRDIQGPLTTLSRLSTRVAKAMVRANRINEVLSERPAVQELPGARVAERFRGHIRFENVSFGYLPGRHVLHDVTLEALPGQVVALVGSSGAGKSSLASLLPRLYDPTEGRVLIDGQDVREFQLESLRSHIAVVLQESLLFRASIRENIAYGRPKASLRQIEEAARVACCDEFLHELPHGLDTVVGERGVTLSGGQRQRIAIARAVIRDAPILILDEPTTGLDAESEAGVMRALERLMEGRTTIMIAHKLSTVLRADKIAVLHQGAIVEVGTHGELLGSEGLYARAFQTQTAALFD